MHGPQESVEKILHLRAGRGPYYLVGLSAGVLSDGVRGGIGRGQDT